ncbi:MAG: sulfurtransferase [Candidatus Dormibacteria bacterium]|jgi:thiosulfate/3-mercaptopyruvate sulfurtransferase
MTPLSNPLVDPGWLLAESGADDLVVLDVRWALPEGSDPEGYRVGHLPDARFVDLDRDLAGAPGMSGRHPLPPVDRFAAAMRRAGVHRRDRVVCYDAGTAGAARAWWLLRAAGHPFVRVLDGGLAGWLASGGKLEAGSIDGGAGDFQATTFQGWVPAEGVATLVRSGGIALDARSKARFDGEPFPLDPRPGHVPGARSFPWTDAYRDGWMISPAEIMARVSQLGGPPAVVYCGSGVTACALILALASAGCEAVRLYPGSWSEWAQDPARPVEVGK